MAVNNVGPAGGLCRPVRKVWGHELWVVNCDMYCGKRLTLNEGWQCSLHKHIVKDETFFVERGLVRLELGDDVLELKSGDRSRVLPGTWHRFAGLEQSIIFEFSTQHDDADVVRKEDSRRMSENK